MTAVEVKAMATNLNLEADSLTTQIYLATHLQTCKNGAQATKTISKALNKCI